ncbi:MAG: SpoIID/LytB domain-containing protein [Myxococcota bacterium]
MRVLLGERSAPVRLTPLGEGSRVVAPGAEGRLLVDGLPVDSPFRMGGGRMVAVDGAPYRGVIEVRARPRGLAVVNVVPLESYVAGTLHRELYPQWDGAVLLAQAVATRTYALYRVGRSRSRHHHLDATAGDQVYGGVAAETPAARRAVAATRGEYLSHGGRPILAVFHSASGGRTATAREVWGRSLPYLVSLEVPGEESSPDAYWRVSVPVGELSALLRGAGWGVGRLEELRVSQRTGSGRVARVLAQGTEGERTLTGRDLRRLLDSGTLRSTLYEIRREEAEFVLVGSGHGHGVGMSQWGARAMARRGASYREILNRFYPGAELRRLVEEPPAVAASGGGG